jgi:hypothetical protein
MGRRRECDVAPDVSADDDLRHLFLLTEERRASRPTMGRDFASRNSLLDASETREQPRALQKPALGTDVRSATRAKRVLE